MTCRQRARCAVVSNFQSAGFFIAEGSKFGGDFLAYPGNPALYHARFVIQITTAEHTQTLKSLIAQARVSHATRKHLIIAKTSEKVSESREIQTKYRRLHHITKINKLQPSLGFNMLETIKQSFEIGNHIIFISYSIILPCLNL